MESDSDTDVAIGADLDDPAFEPFVKLLEADYGDPVDDYVEPEADAEREKLEKRLADVENSHAIAASRLRDLFAG